MQLEKQTGNYSLIQLPLQSQWIEYGGAILLSNMNNPYCHTFCANTRCTRWAVTMPKSENYDESLTFYKMN
jgi:hypothetical protein